MKRKTYSVTKGNITVKQQVSVQDHVVQYGDLRIITKNGKERSETVVPVEEANKLSSALVELRFAFLNDELF